jgi:hypothetical protein
MRAVRLAALAAIALSVVAAGGPASARPKPPPPVSIQAANFRFCAASASTCLPERDDGNVTTVRVGTTVTWLYEDKACDAVVPCPGHNVLFARGGGERTLVKSDGARILRMKFARPGSYSYYCGAHQSFGMTGTIVVTRH